MTRTFLKDPDRPHTLPVEGGTSFYFPGTMAVS
jgi:hypothetical protein